ncbi:hypothetical protein CAC42_8221 [Sphaceloma murrayae]|uniref:Phenylacetaldoxime dehydratase n=1 Tax=Sphaceloma murrayae TaxID=2082308 RepID=A0A2K1QJZ4_9PEZI|nr:hypothetical protein CAC42_8221 [Sphaceloma murrayae]
MGCPMRKYPLKRPSNHQAPVPRFLLRFPDHVKQICTLYFGAQSHSEGVSLDQAADKLQSWLSSLPSDIQPYSYETFAVEHGQDILGTRVWVCYWTLTSSFESAVNSLDLAALHSSLASKDSIGLWSERFNVPVERLETNFMGTDYMPGLARLEGTWGEGHDLTSYWGAARDRIPDSAIDLFSKEEAEEEDRRPPHLGAVKGLGQHIKGANPYNNLCHIRSGQYWEHCEDAEREAYETKLKKVLISGLGYLWENPYDNGVIGLRFMRNLPKPGDDDVGSDVPRKESCGAGFFRNMCDLEHWAEKHMSHLRIWTGAISHAKKFGEDMKLRLFHEVSILKKGEAHFDT